MSVAGYANQEPIATNSTSEGRAKNRRVEIVLSRIYHHRHGVITPAHGGANTMVKKLVPVIVAARSRSAASTSSSSPSRRPRPEPKPKVHGSVYMLEKEFLVNLHDGRFAKLQVGLILAHDDTSTVAAGGGHGAAPTPPEGYGAMAQEGVVRDVITDVLTDAHGQGAHRGARVVEHLKEEILKDLKKHTDVKVEHVLFSDVTVQ